MNFNPTDKIFLIGMMGSGKSYWGKKLSEIIHLDFIDLDEVLVNEEGRDINKIFQESGEQYFRDQETKILNRFILEKKGFIMATGGGVPCFNNNISNMNNHGITIWLNESPEVIFRRLLPEKVHRPLIKELNNEELHDFILLKLAERKAYYRKAKYIIKSTDIADTFNNNLISL